jgi:uncharacterized protein (TIGR02145 family)
MRKKTHFLIYPLLLMGVFLIFASSCKKDDDDNGNGNNTGIPVLSTTAITDITQTTAKSGGNITSDGGATVTVRGVCWSTNQTPTISDNKTTDGTGAGNFVSSISGLTANTTYYVRAYATNSNGTAYGSVMSFTTQEGSSGSTFTDPRDGKVYITVIIGDQEWMAENLKYLPSVVGPGTGSKTTPHYYVYGYNGTNVTDAKATAKYNTYGVLYNWPAAMNGAASSTTNPSGVQGVCPDGWHLPSDAEWTELTDYLGGTSDAGRKLKETGTTHWSSPNTGATNETGFTALPGGARHGNGTFYGIGYSGYWWSATESSADKAWYRRMFYSDGDVLRSNYDKELGFSVRCLRD